MANQRNNNQEPSGIFGSIASRLGKTGKSISNAAFTTRAHFRRMTTPRRTYFQDPSYFNTTEQRRQRKEKESETIRRKEENRIRQQRAYEQNRQRKLQERLRYQQAKRQILLQEFKILNELFLSIGCVNF